MELEEKWQRTLEETKIARFYRYPLSNIHATSLPYIFLGASAINVGDTVVRKGKIVVDRPLILLPKNLPQFFGFDLEKDLDVDEDALRLFFLVRGIRFPSLKYQHESATIDVVENYPEHAAKSFKNELESKEDLMTGLIVGNAEFWQLAVLLYVTLVIGRSVPSDMEKFMDDLRRGLLP